MDPIITVASSDYEDASLLFIDLSPEFDTLPTFSKFLLKLPQQLLPNLRKLQGTICPDYENMIWAPFTIDGRSVQLSVYESWYLYYNQASIDHYLAKFLSDHEEVRQAIAALDTNVEGDPPKVTAPPLGWHVPMNQMISSWLYLLRPLSHPIQTSVSPESPAESPHHDTSELILDRWEVPPVKSQHDDRPTTTLRRVSESPLITSTPIATVNKPPPSPNPDLCRTLSRYLHLLGMAHYLEFPRTPIGMHPPGSYSSIDTGLSRPMTNTSTRSRSSFRAHTKAWTSAVASRILAKFHRREKIVAPSPEIPFDTKSWHSFYQ
ncbi:hypothetical protein JNB11_00850 [Kocuria palustris]|nr:hypothetical protein [Kocuria palustris]